MKYYAIVLLSCLTLFAKAQFTDDFTDNDFITNPAWAGDNIHWHVNSNHTLQLNNTVADTSYLSTACTLATNAEWRFYIKQSFSPSGSNYGRVYLMSDSSDLRSDLNGYFLQFGEAGSLDAVELFRQDGNTVTSIARGVNGQIATSFAITIKITKDIIGSWNLYVDAGAGNNYILEATGIDNTYSTSSYFGVRANYTSSNASNFYFDNFYVGPIIVDSIAPTVTGVNAVNANNLDILFSETIDTITSQNISNYFVNNAIGNPLTAIRDTINLSMVHLNFSNSFINNNNYTITINNVQDISNNQIAANTLIPFTYTMLGTAIFGDIVIDEIMADPTPVVGLPDAEYIELFNRTINPVSTSGWTLSYGNTIKNLSVAIIPRDSFLVITTTLGLVDLSIYGNVIDITGLSSSSLTNTGTLLTLKDNNGTIINTIVYSDTWYNDATKSAGGWSLEMIDPNNYCNGSNNWTSSNDPSGGTPGRKNSAHANNPDITAPNIIGVRVITNTQLEIYFSEDIADTSSIHITNISINNGIGNPTTLLWNDNPVNSAIITITNPIQQNIIYTLTINTPLTDCVGNSLNNASGIFANYPVQPYDVVINEIMSDPTPTIGLPDFEYIELYNKTSYPININNWKLSINGSIKILPPAVILPHAYIVLTSSQGVNALNTFSINTIGVTGFSSSTLTNTGTTLILSDTSGTTIHAIDYSDSWYQDNIKINGGWSLEQIDPGNPCGGKNNWRASVSNLGGTPGSINSINATNPDIKAPTIVGICITSSNSISIQFSEAQDSASVTNLNNYIADNNLGQPIGITTNDIFYDLVTLTFNTNLTNADYTLSVNSSIHDCVGNQLSANTIEQFSLYNAQPYDITINEIMADETPGVGLPSQEYFELFNRTSKAISLQGYNITIGTSHNSLGCISIKPNNYLTILPANAITNEDIYGNDYLLPGFSSITNTGEEITLNSPTGKVISDITFKDSWYNNSLKSQGGWSLEQIDPNNPCAGESNWQVCNDNRGGTPGRINSVNASNPDNTNPEISRIAYINPTTIIIYFSESLKASTLNSTNTYTIDNGIGHPLHALPLASDYNRVELILPSPIQKGIIYNLTVDATITDCVGNTINTIITGKFAIPGDIVKGDLILNELLFDPKTNGYDFAELYNASSKVIDLKQVRVANIDSSTNTLTSIGIIDTIGYLVFPAEYKIISENGNAIKKQYFTTNTNGFINIPAMPALNISSGSFAFALDNNTVLDALTYDIKMHYPLLNNTKGVSLERISFTGSSIDRSNWHSAAETVGFATPGYINSQHVNEADAHDILSFNNEIFSPDNDGYNDVLVINYLLTEPGMVANCDVFDPRGRLIKKLLQNILLSTSGSFVWDGINTDNEKATIGIYTLYFEYFDTKGTVKKTSQSFVLAGKL